MFAVYLKKINYGFTGNGMGYYTVLYLTGIWNITTIIEKHCNFQIVIESQNDAVRTCLMVFRKSNFKIFLTVSRSRM